MLAVILVLGALIGPQELSDVVATGEAQATSPADALAMANGAGQGAVMRSDQTLASHVSGVAITVTGEAAEIRTGDISLGADGVGSGIQALNINTGIASATQASVSIATGSLILGAAPK
jgi:hypothetical protein